MKKVRMTILMVILILTVSWLCEPMQAGIIMQDQRGGGWAILYASPTGQTFTAEDEYIQSIGFWLEDWNPTLGPLDITIELFQGEGIGGQSLGSAPVEGLYPGFDGFFDASFDFVRLEVGQMYTAILSSPNMRAAVRWFQWAPSEGGTPLYSDPYTGGDVIFRGQIKNYGDATFRVIPESATPPIADADGPYSIYVGDTLTLDASGSTDADDYIVSYIWNLDDDDDGTFETYAGGQAIFDVNYTYLESLGLIVGDTYDIHLKVTDSVGQSDTADSTLTIVPPIEVAVDIKPGSCPNPLNVKSRGVLPVAILGSQEFDVTDVDVASIQLAGVDPNRSSYEDVATPVTDENECECTEDANDGYLDLTLKFKTQEIVEAIGDVDHGDVLTLDLDGVLFGERPIVGTDCIVIRGRHKPFNEADINKDGVVNMTDFTLMTKNWLQSSIVDE